MGSRQVAWMPPQSFDEYRLVESLGRGSMGQVWLAHDTVLDRLVAVKFIAGLPAHDVVRKRFLTEARAAARVQHPNIIAVYRIGEIGPRPYLISEYVCGESLDKLARPVAWPRLLKIAIGLARGLAAAHRQGVLHRDLKPANAIVSETGEVKLLDFGLAKLLPHIAPPHADAAPDRGAIVTLPGDPGESTSCPYSTRESEVATGGSITLPEGTLTGAPRAKEPRGPNLAIDPWPSVTRTGAVIGTPAYMSPEAWRGEPSTLRSDVYSLGALLYALGAGAPPHRGDSPEVAQEATLACDAPSLAVAVPGINARFAAIVDRCLRRDPAERFASGDDVREALEALAAGDAPALKVLAQAPHVRPALHPPRAILGVVLALVLALVLAFFAYPNVSGEPSRLPVHAAPTTDARREAPAQRSPDAPALTADARSVGAVPGGCPEGMVPVPAGTFQMGSPEGEGGENEHPQHKVTLSAYCIDRREVTMAAYAECVAAGGCGAALHTVNWKGYVGDKVKLYSGWCNREDRPDHPINCVDWDQAVAYCAWKGKRLPTEAEWEYAARGGDRRVYPWGNEAPSAKRLNVCDSQCVAMSVRIRNDWPAMHDGNDGWETTAPVGSYPDGESPFGALDMAGNVWEWTADWYGVYTTQAETNPQGPSTGTSRVYRGGGWATQDPNKPRAAFRGWNTPMVRDCDVGFRCARGD